MDKKTEVPFRNSAGEIYVPPAAGHCDATPQPTEEDPEYSAAFDEAIVVTEQKDKRKIIEAEIEKIESYIPGTPQDSIRKDKALKAAQQRLKSLTEPKRSNQRHKLKVREIANKIWQKHPDWTIQKLIESNEVNAATTPRVYSEKTLRSWIKNLATSNAPGRRKGHR